MNLLRGRQNFRPAQQDFVVLFGWAAMWTYLIPEIRSTYYVVSIKLLRTGDLGIHHVY